MKTAYVHIIGAIGNESEKDISVEKVRKELDAQKPFDEIQVLINSRGGDPYEAFAINAVLRSYKKPVKTFAMSECASAATLIFAEGDVGHRESLPRVNLVFHNPWGKTQGDAEAHEKRAEFLRKTESLMADYYVERFGIDRDTITSLMKEDKSIVPQDALEIGLIDKITEEYAVAASISPSSLDRMQSTINQINQSEMSQKNEKAEGALDKIKAIIKGWAKAEVTDTVEETPEKKVSAFEDALSDGTVVTIEAVAMVNGEPAPDGDHVLSSGVVITVSGGQITSIGVAQASSEEPQASNEDKIKELESKVEQVLQAANKYKASAEAAEKKLHEINTTVMGAKEEVEKEQYDPERSKVNASKNPFAEIEAEFRRKVEAKRNR